MRTQISYWRVAFAALVLGSLIAVGGVLNLKQSQAAVGTVTLTVDSSSVSLGGRAVFTGSIPTGSTQTAFSSVTINLAPSSSQEVGLPSLTLSVDPTSGTVSSGTTAVYKKFTSAGCVTGSHTEGATSYTLTCTATDVISSGSITGSGYVFVKILPYLEGWQAGTMPGGTLPSTLPGTLPAGQPSSAKIDYVVTWKPDLAKSPAPPGLAKSLDQGGDPIIASALLGDQKGTMQTVQTGGLPNFPTFQMEGMAMCPGSASPQCNATGMDIVGNTVYVSLDGKSNQNDVIGTFQVMGSMVQFQGDFVIQNSSDTGDNAAYSLSEVTGVARLGASGNFMIVGGTSATDGYIAMVNPQGNIQDLDPVGSGNMLKLADQGSGNDQPDNGPGGLAIYDAGSGNYHVFVAEREISSTNTAVIQKFNYNQSSNPQFSFVKSMEITLSGNAGFTALGYDHVNQTLIGSAPDDSNITNLVQIIYTGTTIFADSAGYISQSKEPVDNSNYAFGGDLFNGLATMTDMMGTPSDPSDDLTQTVVINAQYKDFAQTQMVAAVAEVSSGTGFFNQPHCVTQDTINNYVYVCLEGRGGSGKGSGFKVYERVSGNYQLKASNNTFGGTGQFSTKLKSGTYVAGKGLYLIDNEYPSNSNNTTMVLINVDTNFGNIDGTYTIANFVGKLGGMTYDSTGSGTLIAISEQNDQFFKFAVPSSSDNNGTIYPTDQKNLWNQGGGMFWPEPGYTGIQLSPVSGVNELLLTRYEMVTRVNPSDGQIKGGYKIPVQGILGGFGHGNVFAVGQDWPGGQGTVYIGSLPGETPAEPTIAEQYTNTFTVADASATSTATSTVTFAKITTNDGLGLTVTSPADGTAFTTADLTAGKIPITGTVTDPTVTAVTFGASLAKGFLVGSPVTAPTAELTLESTTDHSSVVTTQDDAKWLAEGYWHVTSESNTSGGNPFNDDYGFYFGRDPDSATASSAYTYGPEGTTQSGGLVSPKFTVGEETELVFDTWWETEPGLDWDQKLVQWCPGANWSAAQSACQTVLQITDQKQESMGGMGGGMMGPMMGPMMPMMGPMMGMMGGMGQQSFTSPGTIFSLSPMGKAWDAVFIPGAFDEGSGPKMTEVSVIFDELLPGKIGQTGYIRFWFNTGDGWGNEMRGWYVDDVSIQGAKSATGSSFAVTYNETSGTYGFTGELEANEGKNEVTLTAARAGSVYNDGSGALTKAVTFSVFLDTTTPSVSMYAPTLNTVTVGTSTVYVTNSSSFTVSGTFTENTPSALTVNMKTITAKPSSGANLNFTSVAAKAAFSGKAADFVAATGNYLAEDVNLSKSYGSTTLSLSTLAGAVEVPVVSVLNFEAGDIVKIDTVASAEYRDITSVSTTDSTITLSSGLSLAHDSAVTFAEQPTIKVKDSSAFAAAQFIAIGIGSKKEVRRITHIVSGTHLLGLENLDDSDKHPPQIGHVSGTDCDTDDANCDTQVVGAEDVRWRVPSTSPIALVEGYNQLSVTMTDKGGQDSTDTAEIIVLLDTTAPTTAKAVAITIVSDNEAVIGDDFFLVVAAEDDKSDIDSVTLSSTSQALPGVANVEAILKETYGLNTVTKDSSTATTSHILLVNVDSASYSVGDNSLTVTIKDTAGNSTTTSATLSVVSKRTNRNFLLFPGTNYVGLALIPDDGDSTTTDDASLSRNLAQVITAAVSTSMQADPAFTSGISLADIITSVSAFSADGNFIVYTPDASADTLTNMSPFQGMIFKVKETLAHSVNTGTTYDVFNKVAVTGFTATQAVPIKMNVQGVFFDPDSTPPSKTLRVGYNLVAPHILSATKFDTVYRGALIPKELATSAIAFDRRVTPVSSTTGIGAEIFEGFTTQSIGDTLKPELAYWTFVVQDAATNPTTPTITP